MLHVWQSDDLYDPVPEKVAISDEPWGELGVVYPCLVWKAKNKKICDVALLQIAPSNV